jgi:hypothetical protein
MFCLDRWVVVLMLVCHADTLAEGVFLITIHHAEGLSAQDRNGRSDPYIVLAYAKVGYFSQPENKMLNDWWTVVWEAPLLDSHHPGRFEPCVRGDGCAANYAGRS